MNNANSTISEQEEIAQKALNLVKEIKNSDKYIRANLYKKCKDHIDISRHNPEIIKRGYFIVDFNVHWDSNHQYVYEQIKTYLQELNFTCFERSSDENEYNDFVVVTKPLSPLFKGLMLKTRFSGPLSVEEKSIWNHIHMNV